jgi:dipeptidyl aminopeptidase/acylaminoacyl peptidase
LAALLGTSEDRPELEGNGGNQLVSSRVQAVVAMACPSDFEHFGGPELDDFIGSRAEHAAAYKAASPVTYVRRTSAPILLLHSESDPGVPFEQSAILERRYRAVGASATLVRVDAPNTHDFWNDTKYFTNVMNQAVEFFRRTLKPVG